MHLKLPFVEISISVTDFVQILQSWLKSDIIPDTSHAAQLDVSDTLCVMGTERSISSCGQRKAAKPGYTVVCA